MKLELPPSMVEELLSSVAFKVADCEFKLERARGKVAKAAAREYLDEQVELLRALVAQVPAEMVEEMVNATAKGYL